MTKFKIDKNIPMPKASRGKERIYPISEMEIGDRPFGQKTRTEEVRDQTCYRGRRQRNPRLEGRMTDRPITLRDWQVLAALDERLQQRRGAGHQQVDADKRLRDDAAGVGAGVDFGLRGQLDDARRGFAGRRCAGAEGREEQRRGFARNACQCQQHADHPMQRRQRVADGHARADYFPIFRIIKPAIGDQLHGESDIVEVKFKFPA